MPRRKNEFITERVVVSYDHAALTASTAFKMFTPTRQFRLDAARYYNPTGLAEHASNTFQVKIQRANALSFTTFAVQGEADDEIFTANAHGFETGDGPVRLVGTVGTGLSTSTDYWVIKINANTFYLATSRANAIAQTAVTYTTDGTGVTIVAGTGCSRLVDVATGVDTDSDLDGTNTLVADSPVALTLTATTANLIFAAGEDVYFVAIEQGTATLPIGRMVVEGRYIS